MDEGYNWLESIADRMKRDVAKGAAPRDGAPDGPQSCSRSSVSSAGASRINNHIRNGLDRFGLRTDQDITVVWLDSSITIELDSVILGRVRDAPDIRSHVPGLDALPAANRKPVSVERDNSPEGSDHRSCR